MYDTYEPKDSHYVIRLKNNRKLSRMAEESVFYGDNQKWGERELQYFSVPYQVQSWSKLHHVCIRSTREAAEFLFQHTFIVTNLSENVASEALFSLYAKRGTMEDFIKEAKVDFYFGKTDSPRFIENQVRMMLSLLEYSLVNFLKTIGLEEINTRLTVQSIRLRFLKVAGKLVETDRRVYLKLSNYHVYENEFYAVYDRLRRAKQWI